MVQGTLEVFLELISAGTTNWHLEAASASLGQDMRFGLGMFAILIMNKNTFKK